MAHGITSAVRSCALLFVALAVTNSRGAVDYNRDIRPILSENCYACHGPDQNKRKAGLRLDRQEEAFAKLESGAHALVAGDLKQSRLIELVSASSDDDRMPPIKTGKRLTAKQIELLRKWVEEGAVWQRHWAYLPPRIPEMPPVSAREWVANDIDYFVLARLEAEKLRPSPRADKITLIRRLTLDLTGLPPTLREVDQFLADTTPDAYERLVDRLLSSPQYGERMAQHWLDLARYADTNGYHIDNHRDMWKWREWVINAFNSNMPFDQFTIEQLAGDLLPNATLEQKVASGFNRNGMVNFEGGADPDEYHTKYVVDRVVTTSTVWLGSPLACAECHDHKYDPFTQKEFYQFYAFFNNIPERGLDGQKENPVPSLRLPTPEQAVRLADLVQSLPDAERNFKTREFEWPAAQAAWEKEVRAKNPSAPDVAGFLVGYSLDESISVAGASRSQKPVRFTGTNAPAWTEGRLGNALRFSGQGESVDCGNTADFERDQPFSFTAWVKAEGNGGVIISKMVDEAAFRGFDLGFVDGRPSIHLVSSWEENALKVTTKAKASADEWHLVTATYDGSSKAAGVKLYLDGKLQEAEVAKDSLKGSIRVSEPLRIGKRSKSLPFKGLIDEVRIYPRALRQEEVATLASLPFLTIAASEPEKRTASQKKDLQKYFREHQATAFKQAEQQLASLKQAREDLFSQMPASMVMEEMAQPRKTQILVRGNFRNKGEVVTPNVPGCLPGLPPNAPPNRLTLAQWLTSPDHPLTSRVTVNRFWQMLFGTGLVKTSNDFGSQGEWPSHPELLDYLAADFFRHKWDVKALLKSMVMSAAYQQSTRVTPDLLERDPYNRLLTRGARFRLDAETIRDNALAISGLLNKRLGGKSVFPYQPPGLWEELAFGGGFSSQNYVQSKGEDLYRRGLYTYWKRSLPYPSFFTFDAPNREVCTAQRPRTSTPLQSLVLLNDPSYVEAARGLAQRVLREAGSGIVDKLTLAFRLAVARPPQPAEVKLLQRVYEEQLAHFRQDKAAAKDLLSVGESPAPSGVDECELAAWTTLGNVILNLDETVTKG